MSAEPTLIDYQREAAELRLSLVKPVAELAAEPLEPAWGVEAAALFRAGWDHQVRLGLRIWSEDESDWRCAWFGEEVAYELVNMDDRREERA